MLKNQLITPEGTKDYLIEEAAVRRELSTRLNSLFLSHGFSEVSTPALEFLDVFSVKGHSIPVEYMYKLTDDKGRLMVIRPDSTMPVARICATRLKDESFPLRLFYNQAVYSSSRKLSGRSEEVLQAGVELISASNIRADLEIMVMAVRALQVCEPESFRLEIGHIGIYNNLVNRLSMDDAEKEQLRLYIETKNYPALNEILDNEENRKAANAIKQLPRLFGGEEIFEKAAQIIDYPEVLSLLSYLENIYKNLKMLSLDDKISVDLGIVNRTDYYTGIVFKGYIEGYGEPTMAGGRYDNLLAQYGKSGGAIGFAVNIDGAVKAHPRKKIAPPQMLVFAKSESAMEALIFADNAAKKGMRVEISTCETAEESVLYANQKNIAAVVEIADGKSKWIKGEVIL